MSISSIQKKIKTEDYIYELAKNGIAPNNYEVSKMLTEHFDNHIAGMPYYSPIKQKPYEESSKDDYNHNFSTLNEDLNVIYRANIEANNVAVAMQEYYDNERDLVMKEIDKLALRVKNMSTTLRSHECTSQYVESFSDVYGLEYYGKIERNLPHTTAFVDLLQKTVYNEKMNSKVNRINISDATIDIKGYNNSVIKLIDGEYKDIINDIFNEYVTIISYDNNDNVSKSINITIDFGKNILFNTVLFKYTSATGITNTLYLSEDGENYVPVYDISTPTLSEWNFPAKLVRYIKIRCTKNECDGISDDDQYKYEYYFLLKNISIAFEKFTRSSVLVSKQITFNNFVNNIRLDAEDMIFSHTNIYYFIGYDNGKDKIGWESISNHKECDLHIFEKSHKIANVHEDGFGDHDVMIDAYKILKLPKFVNENTIKVTPGYHMWDVRRYRQFTNGIQTTGFSLDSGDYSDYINGAEMSQFFMDCENYNEFEILSNTLYIFTQYISMPAQQVLFNAKVSVSDPDTMVKIAGQEVKVFINGYETSECGNSLYTFNLRKGVNKVQIAIYCPNNEAVSYKFTHSLNFKSLTSDVFSSVPMKYVSNVVMNKIVKDGYDYYTIKDNCIYIKENPVDMVRNNLEEMPYFISFYSLKPNMRELFPDGNISLRIMAVMNTDDDNMSPKINNFRITGR